jgi:hypothetical protein
MDNHPASVTATTAWHPRRIANGSGSIMEVVVNRPQRPRRFPAIGTRRTFVPRLEVLDDRNVPSTLTVSNNLDHGAGSLRGTLAGAASGDTVIFASSLDGKTITLTSGVLSLLENVTIQGPGAGALTISGNGKSEVFYVGGGTTATISGLTIAHGWAPVGGGIGNDGTLTLRNVTLSANQAVNGIGGGGIANDGGAMLTLSHCVITGNRATTTAGNDVFGGGLFNEGQAVISSTTFQDNQALGGGTTDFFGGSVGGAIANTSGGHLIVTGSTFTNNEAVSAAGTGYFATGGAIENDAGPDLNLPSTANISDSTFTGNQAIGGTGSSANGGGLDNQGSGATMSVTKSTLTGNRALGGSDAGAGVEGLGGGIMNVVGSTLVVDNSTLTDNLAQGGSYNTPTSGNLPFGPSAGAGQGGGILNGAATATITDTTLNNNEATGGPNILGPGSFATGGGIENFGNALVDIPGSLTVIGCTLRGNEAIAGTGGVFNTGVPTGFAAGGGIDDSFDGHATVLDSTLINNSALGSAGGIAQPGGIAMGGGISVGSSTLFGMTDNSTLVLSDSTLTNNRAFGGTGGGPAYGVIDPPVPIPLTVILPPPYFQPGGNGGDGLGGGIAVAAASSASVEGGTIQNNYAYGGAPGIGGTAGHGIGGGAYDLGSVTFDIATVVTSNKATTSNNNIYP